MKVQKIKVKQLFKLNLLKSKVYEKSVKKNPLNKPIDCTLNQIIIDIKKALQVIFQYHKAKKQILFIGLPFKIEQKINRLTIHSAISNSFDVQGLISNFVSKSYAQNEKLDQNSKILLPKLLKQVNLIVLFEHRKNKSVVLESKTAKIPLIVFGEINESTLYSIKGNFKNVLNSINENIFCIGLNFLFKKK